MYVYCLTIFSAYLSALLAQNLGKRIYRKDLNTEIIQENQNNKFFVFLTSLILIAVSSLRWKVGTDYVTYSNNYEHYVENAWNAIMNFNEPGIKIIAKISSWIYDDYFTMFLIVSMITLGLSVKTISKRSTMFSFSILLFIFMGFWHGSFNGVRQYIAVAIIFAGHGYIINKNIIKYAIVVFLASMFHTSALLMFFLYFIPNKKIKYKHWVLILIGIAAVLTSYDYIFQIISDIQNKDSSLLETFDYAQRNVNIFRVITSFAPLMLYVLVTDKKQLGGTDRFYINLLFINALVALATMGSAYLYRFVIYTNIFCLLAYPSILKVNNKYLQVLLKYLIILFYAVFWYYEVISSSSLNDFQWIFERF